MRAVSERPFSQACDNNKDVILEALAEELQGVDTVLELGSGTGQHASYFAQALAPLTWQPTDLPENHAGIEAWRETCEGGNLLPVRTLDVRSKDWNLEIPDAIFTANTLHIMAWEAVEDLFAYLGQHAPTRNRLCVYGPFNYRGKYTSESNARFDKWLAQQSPVSAIRDFERVDGVARRAGYRLQSDHGMPANNRLLVWHKRSMVTASP